MAFDPDGRRKELCDWLTANGIDPRTVPIRGDLTIGAEDDQRVIRYEAFVLTDDGRQTCDPRGEGVDGAAVERRTVPLLVEPPDWWEPYEKPTRSMLLAAVERVRKAVTDLHADAASARQMGHETSALAIEGSARRISRALNEEQP
jgi:hypothetical protein